MSRLVIAVVCLFLIGFGGNVFADQVPKKKKNILFIFADDLSYEAVQYAGMVDIETPNLDRLAARGTRFTHAYNSGAWNGAVCLASRAMLNTGQQLWSAHRQNQKNKMRTFVQNQQLWSQRMKQQGYETYFTGKWHVSAPAEKVFDHVRHIRGGMPGQSKGMYNRPTAQNKEDWSPYDKTKGGFWAGGKHWSEVVAEDTEIFLKQAKSRDQPFFMYIAFNAAHDPRQSPKGFLERYPLSRMEVPENYLPLYPFKDAIGCSKNLRDEKLAPFPRTKHSILVHRQEYYALITHMDHQIGRILKALKDSGMAEDTYIIFTADHGLSVGHHGLLGKQNMYDHSVRVPMLWVGPEIPKKKVITTPIYLQDVMATSLKIAGDTMPTHFEDLMPMMKNQTTKKAGTDFAASDPEGIYGAYLKEAQRMIVYENYKLILYPKAKVFRLFDLQRDPLEMNSLADQEGSKERVDRLFKQFKRLQIKHADPLKINSLKGYVGK